MSLLLSNLFFHGHINKWQQSAFIADHFIEIPNFEAMQSANVPGILVENTSIESEFLQRKVKIDFYMLQPPGNPSEMTLLLINDGQDMEKLGLVSLLEGLYADKEIEPILFVGIHAGTERRLEYGIAGQLDYNGRGAKAGLYTSFILQELIPFIGKKYAVDTFRAKAFAGFSLGGLSAMDIIWSHPEEFQKLGIFSGSFWWRSIDQTEEEYDDEKHRIMHQLIRNGRHYPGLKFFFQCGNMDETRDRNQNGIIDSIDDTRDIIKELIAQGYDEEKDIYYLELKDGRHDVPTWGRAMPTFLKWGWSIKKPS